MTVTNSKKRVVIIGGGPAGFSAALRIVKLGGQAILIERENFGGTCLHKGCIPTKAILEEIKKTNKVLPKWLQLVEKKNKIVQKLNYGLEAVLKNNGIKLIKGKAKIIDFKIIEINDRKNKNTLTFDDLIIATGAKPKVLNHLPFDHQKIIDSSDALNLKNCPEKITIVGGGPIGIEFAQIFNSLGSEVSLIEILDRLLPKEDKDISETTKDILEVMDIKVLLASEQIPSGITLVTIGRQPQTQEIIRNLSLKLNQDGSLWVDERMQTNIEHIWAIGDVIGKKMSAHAAFLEAKIVAENITRQEQLINYQSIPNCVFGFFEIASVGLTEELAQQTHQIKTGKAYFKVNSRAICMDKTQGFVKIIADKNTEEVLGVHIIGPEASSLISEASLVIQNKITLPDLEKIIHPHPTLAETFQEAIWMMN